MSGYGGGYGRGRRRRGQGAGGGYGRGGGGGPPPWAGQGRCRWGAMGYQGVSAPIAPQPQLGNVLRIIATTLDGRGLESTIAPTFARSPYITIVDIVDGKIVRAESIPNPYSQAPHGVGRMFSQWIIGSGARAVIAAHVGMNASQILGQAGIRIHIVQAGTRLMNALKTLGYIG